MISPFALSAVPSPLQGKKMCNHSLTFKVVISRFIFSASFGIFCSTPGIAVARTANRMKVSQMLLTGLPVSANEALMAGLVSQVAHNEELDKVVADNVNAICHKSRSVIELGKRFFYQQLQMDVQSAYTAGADTMSNNLNLPDGKEGITSFVEKRKPQWKE